MSVVRLLLIGLVVGGLGRFLIPKQDQAGPIGTFLLAVTGALFAGLFAYAAAGSSAYLHTAAATTGAVVMLASFHYLVGRHSGMR